VFPKQSLKDGGREAQLATGVTNQAREWTAGPSPSKVSRALEAVCGVDIDSKALANKVGRSTFSFSFFLQCMRALGVDTVRVND
jgi:hypothetical protein